MKIDMHVHMVGNGSGGSGCWVRPAGWRLPFAAFLLNHIGLPLGALKGELDRLYAERVLELVKESSLDAAVILAHERVYDDGGRVMEGVGSFYVPNEYVLRLGREHSEFLPAVSIHPARADAMEELERCLAGGAVMMKLLPNCHNVDCNERRFRKFWERMAQAGLPLLAHTGGEYTVPVVRKELSDPRTLELPLECGVTVIAAHCGTRSGPVDPQYFEIFEEMTRRHPRLYGDNSAFTVPVRGSKVRECLREPLVSRMLHGSDFPIPVFGHYAWWKGYVDGEAFRRVNRISNVLERDYQLKRAMGFPEEVFTRMAGLLRVRERGERPTSNIERRTSNMGR